jgi:hypothetical protein
MNHPSGESVNIARAGAGTRLPLIAWAGVAILAILVGLELLIEPWIQGRVRQGGEVAVPSALWSAIDFLTPIRLLAPDLACLLFAAAAWSTWRAISRRRPFPVPKAMRVIAVFASVIATLAAIILAIPLLDAGLSVVTRSGLCQTTTYQSAVSPNGRYEAAVVEVDCGAATGFNRQVLVTRRPFSWASTSILYFREHPSLQLAWSGRTLTIRGERASSSMDRPPPDPIIWGGMLARYSGPKE